MTLRLTILRRHRRDHGSAVLVLLALLSIAAILTVSDHMALRHLFGELKLIETQQKKKYPPPLPPFNPPSSPQTNNNTNTQVPSGTIDNSPP
jgi:hypothetical protein